MRKKQKPVFINVDPDTLEIAISGRRENPMAIPTAYDGGLAEMPPMWEAVYFHYMYRGYYRRQRKQSPRGPRSAACLAPPPAWLVGIAAVMWEGIIQGATWDVVKMGVRAAMSKLQAAGLGPPAAGSKKTDISIRAGWRKYSDSGRKQYEMFLSLKRTISTLPDRHALAYARAANKAEFGRIVRQESDIDPAKIVNSPRRVVRKDRTKVGRKKTAVAAVERGR